MGPAVGPVPGSLVESLRPHAEVVLPLLFVGFFLAAGLAVFRYRDPHGRPAFLAGFLVALLLFQTVAPVAVPPFVTWHKFSTPWEPEEVRYELRVVDAEGGELKYDKRGTLAFDGVRMSAVRHAMREELTDRERREVARFLLDRARSYRRALERGDPRRGLTWTGGVDPPPRPYRFPAHGHASAWSVADVRDRPAFVGLRLYRLEVVTSDDGSEVVAYSEELLYEYDATADPAWSGSGSRADPTADGREEDPRTRAPAGANATGVAAAPTPPTRAAARW